MKYILVALMGLSMFNANALETIKVLDGKKAFCEKKTDVFRSRMGAYTLNADAVSVTDGQVTIETTFKFLRCNKVGESFAWEVLSPLETLTYQTPQIGNQPSNEITVITNKATIKAYRDGIYSVLTEQELIDDSQNIDVTFALDEVMSEADKLLFDAGLEVKLDTDIFLVKNITLEGLGFDYRSNSGFGAFRVRYSVQKDDAGNVTAKKL